MVVLSGGAKWRATGRCVAARRAAATIAQGSADRPVDYDCKQKQAARARDRRHHLALQNA
ncbi:MAG: hypothetical protein D6753_06825 [Planctomycetota bacterium]|nr:MAG: hypothetical protein D6753_06825 [Planctomycetota bacterium]